MEIIEVNSKELIEKTASLADEIWREHYVNIISIAQIDYMVKNLQSVTAISNQISNEKYSYFLIKDDNGSYEGYFAVAPKDGCLFLSKIYVRKESRKKGYAKKSLEFIKKFAKSLNLDNIVLNVSRDNAGSIEAYKKMNFKICGEIDLDIGSGFYMNDYKMVLQIGT
ncbi:MAG: GNAT family N-acetyltransferase [Endomicrobia bacterium]|nr:GNAT family N-acetyltransferase [Endomicrobiia bacterium]MCL2800017.1 GNAT family N-acetyltransferase [Endomicrobiia bacterium]